ncbi:MAG TPA: hypothetical protein VHE34_04380 [Puia sp.]|uniref:hypothetical protein n=1 Tax=Puia sp. TaxID=2045100 RepID=UPI002B8B69A0|nr:hypothetical protein [Puia sp.]HVU94433.1 hypothetical protein [Puia sp.]
MGILIILLSFAAGYLAAGTLFALVFVLFGVQKVDPTAHGATAGFRIIIIPGCILLWPILLRKWLNTHKTETP